MNQDQVKGQGKQLKGEIKKAWSRLTDDEIGYADGQMDKFFGAVQEKYGQGKEEVQKRLKELEDNYDSSNRAA